MNKEYLETMEDFNRLLTAYIPDYIIHNNKGWVSRIVKSVEQALIKAQEQEKENTKLKGQMKYLSEVITDFQKVLKIINEKNVDIDFLKSADTFEEYNKLIKFKSIFATELTEEDFNLLKRYFKYE